MRAAAVGKAAHTASRALKTTTERYIQVMTTRLLEAREAYDKRLITDEEWEHFIGVAELMRALREEVKDW